VRGLLIPPHRDGMDLPDFDWSQFSLIRFGASVESLRVHTVTSDQSHCSRLAYEKARELGYRRIGYASHIQFEKNTKGHFREGYLNAQEELAPHRGHLEVLELGNDASRQAKDFATWFKRYKPDAIISTLPNVRELIERLKLRVPRDVAVATTSLLDGNFDSGSDQNSQEIGRVAVSTLAGLIIENERGIPAYQRRILVEGRWVQGTSMPPVAAVV